MWPPPPPATPLRRGDLGWGIAVGIVVALAAVGAYVYVTQDTLCAGCPASFPLHAVLSLGTGTGACPAGNGSSSADCAYTFPVRVAAINPPAPLTLGDLTFELQDANDAEVGLAFSVTLAAMTGCGLGTWNSSISSWSPATAPGECRTPFSTSTPVLNGETLVLAPIPRGGLPFSQPGDHLIAQGTGPDFTGQAGAGIV